MSDPSIELLLRLAVALAVGLLIGLERGWEQRDKQEGERVAGLRTYGLVSLLGAVAVVLAGDQPVIFAAIALVIGLVVAIAYFHKSRRPRRRSATGTIALILTFTIGAMAGRGLLAPSAAIAVVVTLLLGFKPELHRALQAIEREELLDTIRLLLISVVVLPILPNQGFGPWEALNPYRMWWMVVLVASVSYCGYVAQRLWGKEWGVLATALFGGMVSSTAVTVDLARRSREGEESADVLGAGMIAASSLMFLRILVILAPVAPALVLPLAAPLSAAGLVGVAVAAALAYRARQTRRKANDRDGTIGNPLDLPAALKFGLLLGAVIVVSRGLHAWLGDRGLYLGAAAAGLADVDAIALSIAEISRGGSPSPALILAILIAAAVNTAVKTTIALSSGSRGVGLRMAFGMTLALAAAGVAYAVAARFLTASPA